MKVSSKLVAGAGAHGTPARGGALTFAVDTLPSDDTWWDYGSASIFYSSFICILYLWN